MALALNGTPGHTFNNSGSTTTVAANITTTVADTIIVAVISSFQQLTSSASRTVNGVAGGSLTWTQRAAQTANVSNLFAGQEVWWAYSSGILTAAAITATFNLAPNQACDIMVFAVSGSPDFASPWDTNVSLPAKATHLNTTTASLPTVSGSTSSTLSLAFEFLAFLQNAIPNSTVGSGWSDITSPQTTGSLRSNWGDKSLSSSGAQTFAFVNNQNHWLVIGDALKGDAIVIQPPVVNVMS